MGLTLRVLTRSIELEAMYSCVGGVCEDSSALLSPPADLDTHVALRSQCQPLACSSLSISLRSLLCLRFPPPSLATTTIERHNECHLQVVPA